MAPLLPPFFLEALMLPQPTAVPQQPAADFTPIGVGIDTSRYGHYAAFVQADLKQAAGELQLVESAVGYALLTAYILDIDRFDTPNQLVAYFGAMPIEVGSGVDRDGKARPAKRYVMCRRGNDLKASHVESPCD